MLDHSKDLSIFGGTLTDNRIVHNNTYTDAKGGFDLLKEQVAHKAFHNSGDRFDAPKCHPRTRVVVLERIMEWIWGREDRDALIMWLYGPAGAGKSSIAQSIAEKCHKIGLLLATFFFAKSDASRNSLHHLIPTLAYQIALHIPETRERITAAILHDPLVFTKALSTQVELLLIEPLRPLMNSGYFSDPTSRRLIIIDGLDECHDPKVQQKIVEQISNTLRVGNVPLIFFVASRPEVHLSITFNLPDQTPILTRLALDDHYKPEDDIRVYLEDSLEQIRSIHPRRDFIPKSWPSPDQVEILVDKASGQFIYAATVVKYVESLQHSPVDRLEVILGLHPPHNYRPFAELDALYVEIFLALDEPCPVVRILGLSNTTGPLSGFFGRVHATASFLSLKPSDVCGYMSNITALVTLGTYGEIEIHHKSLLEFLEDPSRAGAFYLDPKVSHAQVVHRYLQIIHNEREFNVACDTWEMLKRIAPTGLLHHCSCACMTEELREDLMHLSIPKFIDFFLRRYDYGLLDEACKVLEILRNLSQDQVDIPDHQPALRKYLLTVLEPYFSHPRLTSLCILVVNPWNICHFRTFTMHGPTRTELLQFDESLCTMDETRFSFHRTGSWWTKPDRWQPIGLIILSTVGERRGSILATLALHLLEYLCDHRFPQITRRRKTDYDSRMIRNAPWTWRQRCMAIKPSRSKLDKDRARAGVPIEFLLGDRESSVRFVRGVPRYYYEEIEFQLRDWHSLSNLIFALDRLPTLLKHAAENEDLITFASRRTIFPQQASHFPRLRKPAQDAVNAYLAKFPANPPAIPRPEHSAEGPDKRSERKPGGRICILFPHFLAFLVYICFLWVTCFA